MKKLLIVFIAAFTLTSCISEKRLFKAYDADENIPKSGMFSEVDGIYPDSCCGNRRRLSQTLLQGITFDTQSLDSVPISQVVLKYNGKEQLNVKLMQGDAVYKDFNLEAERKSDYLSIKRNLYLLPIPFFVIYYERRLILFTDNVGTLISLLGTEDFAFILFMAGGQDYVTVSRYKKSHLKND